MNALQIDSEGRIVEVVLGTEFLTEFLTMGDNKTMPNNWCKQFARKVSPSDNSVRYSSVYDSPLDRLAIAR